MVEFIRQILFVPKCKRCFKPADSNNLCSNCARELAKCRISNPHLPLEKKLEMLKNITGFKEVTVCEDYSEHYDYWKEHFNPNPNDCCNLRLK